MAALRLLDRIHRKDPDGVDALPGQLRVGNRESGVRSGRALGFDGQNGLLRGLRWETIDEAQDNNATAGSY
jgi:hypothetical protein